MLLQNPSFSISTKEERAAGQPEKTKGSFEIIKETLQELKQPSAWLRYTKEIAAGAAGQAVGKEKGGEKKQLLQWLRKPAFWITVALIIILAILLLS